MTQNSPDYAGHIEADERLSLGEGNTPLVRSRRIGPAIGLNNLYFKLESLNPTGSYKDRFAAAAVTEMLAKGDRRVVGSSSGNAGAAVAAYCAAAGIACQIAVVSDAPDGKLKQMLAYGAQLWKIHDFGFDPQITHDVMTHLTHLGQRPGTRLQITAYCHSAVGMAGVEQISHELAEQIPRGRIEHLFACAGGGGLILALAKGFESLIQSAALQKGPRVHCVQPIGNDTIAGPLRAGKTRAQPCARSTTRITGLQVPNLLDGQAALEACQRSQGLGYLVSDETIYELQARLAQEEGIFCEPAGATPLAGALQAVQRGEIDPDETVVCLITGAGFKDPAAIDRIIADQHCPRVSFEEFRELTTSPPSNST